MANINSILTQRLVDGYDYLNRWLFDNQLTPPVITIDPWSNQGAYYVPQKFFDKKNKRHHDLIAFSADLVDSTNIKVLSSLSHEMGHQLMFNRYGTNDHDKNWVSFMKWAGLPPHAPGHHHLTDAHIENFTDNFVDHTVLRDGRFAVLANDLIDMGWQWDFDLIRRY